MPSFARPAVGAAASSGSPRRYRRSDVPAQKVVRITGASSGVGQSTARLLSQRGYKVFEQAAIQPALKPSRPWRCCLWTCAAMTLSGRASRPVPIQRPPGRADQQRRLTSWPVDWKSSHQRKQGSVRDQFLQRRQDGQRGSAADASAEAWAHHQCQARSLVFRRFRSSASIRPASSLWKVTPRPYATKSSPSTFTCRSTEAGFLKTPMMNHRQTERIGSVSTSHGDSGRSMRFVLMRRMGLARSWWPNAARDPFQRYAAATIPDRATSEVRLPLAAIPPCRHVRTGSAAYLRTGQESMRRTMSAR